MNNTDRRVVEMQFDNKDFEENIRESIQSLNSLKDELDLTESAKHLSAFERAANKLSFHHVQEQTSILSERFSALGVIASKTFENIADVIWNCGAKVKNFVDQFTIDPVFSGFEEYETQINAIQTILSNTRDELTKAGYSDAERLEIVNDRLDQLNHYADKTIYNFTEMTRNIGTFTAAGVKLDTAVSSIQGIANLAAVSGSTSEQASRAMYQLSQAISSGTVRLMDWNSVVNAGMGGEIFQKALKRTAKAMGIAIDETKSFRESLSDGWLTSDVLTTTLEQFSWDFEQIAKDTELDDSTKETLIERLAQNYIGEGDEAEEALEKARKAVANMTDLTVEGAKEIKKAQLLAQGYTTDEADEIIRLAEDATEAATKVKTFTQLLDTLKEAAQSGWTQTWEYIIGDFEEAKALFSDISNYFGKIIDASATSRNELVKGWKDLGGRDDLISGFWNIIESIQNVVSAAKEEFQKIFPPATSEQLASATKGFRELTERIRGLTEDSEKMEYFRAVVGGIAKVLHLAKSGAEYLITSIKQLFTVNFSLSKGIQSIAGSLRDGIIKMDETVRSSEAFQIFAEWAKELLPKLKEKGAAALDAVHDRLSKIAEDLTNTDFFDKAGEKIGWLLGSVPKLADRFLAFGSSALAAAKQSALLNTVWTTIKTTAKSAWKVIRDVGSKIAGMFGELSGSDLEENLSSDSAIARKPTTFGQMIKARIEEIQDAFQKWETTAKTCWENIKNFFTKLFTVTIPGFFSEVIPKFGSFLKQTVSVLTGLIDELIGALVAIAAFQAIKGFADFGSGLKNIGKGLKNFAKGFKEISENGLKIKNIKKESLGSTFLKIAAAIGILVASIYVIAKMDANAVKKGLGVISLLAAELLGISLLFKSTGADGKSFLAIAAAVTLLVIPIKLLAAMPLEEAKNGMFRLGVILTELALFTRLAGKGFTGKTGFLGLAVAVTVLTYAIKKLGAMDAGNAKQGIITLGAVLLELGIFLRATSKVGKIGGLISLSIAIGVMTFALEKLGKMKFSSILKSLLALGGITAAFAIIGKSASGIKMGGAVTLLLGMAGAMALFIYAFKEIEGSDLDGMLKFSVSISAILLALSVSLKIMSTIPVGAAFEGALGLAMAMGVMTVAIAAIIGIAGAIGQIEGSIDFINTAGEVLGAVGNAIGQFAGNLIGGAIRGIVNLPKIGTDLSNFMTNAQGFFDGCKDLDSSVLEGVGYLCGALLAITGTELVVGITRLFGILSNPIDEFAEQIKTLAGGLTAFGIRILPLLLIPDEAISKAVNLADSLAEIASKISGARKFFEIFREDSALGTFAKDIGNLGLGLSKFGLCILPLSLVSQTAIDRAVNTADSLSKISGYLSEKINWFEVNSGETAFGLFAKAVGNLGLGLSKFGLSVITMSLVPQTAIDRAVNTADSLSKIAGYLSEKINWFETLSDTTAFGMFVENIGPLGKALSSFGLAVIPLSAVPKTATDRAIDVATSLAGISGQLSESETLFDWLSDNSAFGTFAEDIAAFGVGLKSFVTEVRKIKYDDETDKPNLDGVIAVAESLAEFEKKLSGQNGMWQLLFGEKDLGAFAENIRSLGTALGDYLAAIVSVDLKDNENAMTVLEDINKLVESQDNSGGLFNNIATFFSGDKHEGLKKSTEVMAQMGRDLTSFMDGVTALRELTFDPMPVIAALFKSIDDNFGEGSENYEWWKKLNGEWQSVDIVAQSKNLGEFGDNFKQFGEGLAYAPTAIRNFDLTKQIYRDFIAFNDEIAGLGTIKISDNFQTIAEQFPTLGSYVDAIESYYDADSAEQAAKGADAIFKLVQSLIAANGLEDTSIDNLQAVLSNFENLVVPNWENLGMGSGSGYMSALCAEIQNGIVQFQPEDGAMYRIFYDTGSNLAIGIKNGMLAMRSSLHSAGAMLANSGTLGVRGAWNEHSPSKVGEKLGVYFDMGLINGFLKLKQLVTDSAGGTAKSAVDAAKAMLLEANSVLPEEGDMTPTIRPVLDLSNVQDGAHRIAGMFGNTTLQQLGLFHGGVSRVNLDAVSAQNNQSSGMTDRNIVAHLEALEDRMGELGDRILNMQVVMDSGETVGALGYKIDRTLGTITSRRGRAN